MRGRVRTLPSVSGPPGFWGEKRGRLIGISGHVKREAPDLCRVSPLLFIQKQKIPRTGPHVALCGPGSADLVDKRRDVHQGRPHRRGFRAVRTDFNIASVLFESIQLGRAFPQLQYVIFHVGPYVAA